MRRAVSGVGALGAMAAVAAALTAGPQTGPLALPPSDPGSWLDWLGAAAPEVAAFAVVRLAVVAVVGHSGALVLVAVVAGAARRPATARAVERAAVPGARACVRWAAATGLALATLTGPAAAAPGAAPGDDPPPVIRQLDEPAPSPAPPPDLPETAPGVAEWTVRPGDHLWGIAEATLAGALGRAPTDAEVAPYWLDVVEANRHRLADAANPDLVFPGQVMVVPPVPRPA